MGINRRKILLFILLTILMSWGLVALYLLFIGDWTPPYSIILSVIYMFMPLLAALIVQKGIYKEGFKESAGIRFSINRWFLLAWLTPAIIVFLSFLAGLMMPGAEYATDLTGMYERFRDILSPEQIEMMSIQTAAFPIHPFWIALINGMLAGLTVNAVAAFGEEAGWRGFLFNELIPLGFWKTSIITGLLWGIWHAPIILQGHNYPAHPVPGVIMMILLTILMSPLLTYLRVRSDSVIAPAIFHGTLNGTAALSFMLIRGGSELTVGIMGISVFSNPKMSLKAESCCFSDCSK